MSNPTPIEKFRPVLTASQIKHICSLARKDSSQESLSVLAVMAMYEYKINQGLIEPAYAETARPTLSQNLGFDEEFTSPESPAVLARDDESLYNRWLESPDGMSVDQLKRVQFYRYNNGKMTPDQEREYESETLGV